MICHDYEQRVCGSADMDVWWSSDPLDPIKPRVVRVIWLNNLLVIFFSTFLFTRNVFSQQLYFRTLHGTPDFSPGCLVPPPHKRWTALPVESTGKVLSRFGSTTLTGILVVGRSSIDE